mgnify:CR=1 FL=1
MPWRSRSAGTAPEGSPPDRHGDPAGVPAEGAVVLRLPAREPGPGDAFPPGGPEATPPALNKMVDPVGAFIYKKANNIIFNDLHSYSAKPKYVREVPELRNEKMAKG